LGGDATAPDGGPGDAAGSQRLPVPAEEFDQRELLRLEKETLGTFLSAHPLGEVREALRARVDCPLTEVANKQDGAWITVGGIVGEAKKVRTRNGGYVMFATLDDLEGQVELFVRDAAGEAAQAIEPDRVVVIRGRVDHKGRGQTSLVVQDAEIFEPDAAELAAAEAKAAAKRDPKQITLSIDASDFGRGLVEELKALFEGFPGESEVLLVMRTREGTRTLRFGNEYRISPSQPLRAQLAEVLGPRAIAA
jgi:DNA polymerase-3 subunit alpha